MPLKGVLAALLLLFRVNTCLAQENSDDYFPYASHRSPNGRWLAYTRVLRNEETGNRQVVLYAADATGRHTRALARCPNDGNEAPVLAGWSPDSRRVLFWRVAYGSSSVNADASRLYDVSRTGGKPRLLTRASRRSDGQLDTWAMRKDAAFSFSPDGRSLLLVQGSDRFPYTNKRIALVDYGTLRRRWLTDSHTAATSPCWSPDGRWIVYAANRDDGSDSMYRLVQSQAIRRIWIMRADGSGKRCLTHDPHYDGGQPSWKTAGGRIRVTRRRFGDGEHVSAWELRSDGSGLRKIGPDRRDESDE